ncbi:DUF4097 family beta strand repeat-containing protein [Companilactobacillus ginsenosidimutans]|uniref:DUF4097 domain-containing protein n=1 Tax=Companilactobacillus ginsenosidimutans TaxID=1007676 RepID=A0A0H4QYD2_9LACO|nr:DUF4097 family beta strand repeat-containing protein [Companilactobacillus ginsenosidimutans]AKP66475.1 hypothetical protein ABM34_02165 [Companilactobacillus ginsenosidimutans]
MTKKILELIDTRINDIFEDYPQTEDLHELSQELTSDLLASAEDKVKAGLTEENAVDEAFDNFGDIEDLIDQTINIDDSDEDDPYKVDIDKKGIRVDNGKKLRIDNSGVFINQGKTLSIDSNGMSVNNGEFFKADKNGVKLGNYHFDSNGVTNTEDTVATKVNDYFDQFDKEFDNNLNTEVYVESLKLVNEQKFSIEELNHLDVTYKSVELTVLPISGNKVILREYMSRNNSNYYAHSLISNHVLSIAQGNYPNLLPLKARVQVLIPTSFIGGLRLSNGSGTANLYDLKNLETIKVDLNSGVARLKNISTGNLAIISKSGSAKLDNVKSDDLLKVYVKSGTVKFNNLLANAIDITAISGSIRGQNLVGGGNIKSHSGIISISVKDLTQDLHLNAKSGAIKITCVPELNYSFDISAKSGIVHAPAMATKIHDTQSFKDGSVGDDPKFTIYAMAVSGAIKLR